MRLQFPIKTLLLVTVVFAGLSLVLRWLAGLDAAAARGIILAFGGGLLFGSVVCVTNQRTTFGKPLVNSLLTVFVGIGAWWFGNHIGSFMLALIVGVLATSQRSALLTYFLGLLGFTVARTNEDASRYLPDPSAGSAADDEPGRTA